MNSNIKLAGIIRESIVDGPGFRFVVFSQGCPHNCPGCHNQETIPFEGGKDTETDKILEIIKTNPILKGVTFSGGEPFCQSEGFFALGKAIKEYNPKLDIVVYTGYRYEELKAIKNKSVENLLSITDLLIDGKFIEKEKDLSLKFRGSKNQRIIDMNETRKNKEIKLSKEYME